MKSIKLTIKRRFKQIQSRFDSNARPASDSHIDLIGNFFARLKRDLRLIPWLDGMKAATQSHTIKTKLKIIYQSR